MKQPIWILPLMLCAVVLIIIVGVFHWNTRERMLDGSRVKHEPQVIHQIEDLLLEELYERNKARQEMMDISHSICERKLNEKDPEKQEERDFQKIEHIQNIQDIASQRKLSLLSLGCIVEEEEDDVSS